METNSKRNARNSVSVHLVVQNRLLREAMGRLFQKRAGILLAGQSPSSDVKVSDLIAANCDVLLLDSADSRLAPNLIRELHQHAIRIKVVLFGMDDDPECFLRAVRLGVSGYLLKDASAEDIISAVRGVALGEAICPANLCMSLFQYVSQEARLRSNTDDQEAALRFGLTFRQRQLLALVAKGMTNKEIAANLNLSEFTVKNHIHRIMKHVDAGSRQQAVDLIRAGGHPPTA
jgi:DNA-binding NarL/FixJ family response regulator